MSAFNDAVESITLTRAVNEGIHDPYILKAVFMAGGGGSGKSFIAGLMFDGLGLKVVNSDDILTRMAKALEIDLRTQMGTAMVQEPRFGLRQRAKVLTNSRLDIYIAGRLGLIIDSTAANVNRVFTTKERLEELGYDCFMVFVNTTLETSLARNSKRDRVVDPAVIEADWKDVQAARDKYKRTFGTDFREVMNDKFHSDEELRKYVVPDMTRMAVKMIDKPVKNPIGKKWIADNSGNLPKGTKLGAGTGTVESVARALVQGGKKTRGMPPTAETGTR